MLTRPRSQEVVNRNRNCNGSKKQGSNVKSGKPGKTSVKELKDKYPLDQNYFEMEEAFLFRYEYKVISNFDFDKNLSEYEQGKVKFVLTQFGLGGNAPPLRVSAKYIKNGVADFHGTL